MLVASGVSWQHVITRGTSDPRHEHHPAVHEGAEVSHPRPPGEQQLCRRQREHRARRLRMVRCPWRVLGSPAGVVWEKQGWLFAWQLVAQNGGFEGKCTFIFHHKLTEKFTRHFVYELHLSFIELIKSKLFLGGWDSMLQIYAETRWGCIRQHRLCPLGAGGWLVQ